MKYISNRDVLLKISDDIRDLTTVVNTTNVGLGELGVRISNLEGRMDKLEVRFSALEGHVDKLENYSLQLGNQIYKLGEKIDMLDERTKSYPMLYNNIDKLMGEIIENRQERVFINNRLNKLEKSLN